jgi:Tfp pilus assembly protein PilN
VLVGVAALTVVLLNTADQGRLQVAQTTNDALTAEQRSYSEVAGIINEISGAQAQLEVLLADDVSPSVFARQLREAAPAGVSVTGLTFTVPGTSTDGTVAGASSSALDDSGLTQLGRIDITGTATDQAAIAAYLQAMVGIEGMTVPYLVSSRTVDGSTEFTAQATLTSEARSGRFAPETPESTTTTEVSE